MKKWVKVLFSVAFSFMFLFISIGYAQLADTLVINGMASFSPEPEGVIITSVTLMEGGTATDVDHGYMWPTNVTSTISGTSGQSVTYKITVQNYSDRFKYAYSGIRCDTTMENNSLYGDGSKYTGQGLTVSVTNTDGSIFAKGTEIEAGKTLTFFATYTIGSRPPVNISTVLNYEFGIHMDSAGGYAAERVLTQFSRILNTKETYNRLTNQMGSHSKDGIFDGVWDVADRVTYVGNVTGSDTDSGSDSSCIEEIFGEAIMLNIQGNDKPSPVSVLIKRKNIDNNKNTGDSYEYKGNWGSTYSGSGCEMTIYMTADPLSNRGAYVPVYVAVFTCGPDGYWYQLGDIYEGSANVCDYDGGSGTGSFNTNNWGTTVPANATARTYTVSAALIGKNNTVLAAAYNYRIASGQNITTVINANDAEANTVFADLLDETGKILDGTYGPLTGTAITQLQDSYDKIVEYLGTSLTKNADGYVISGKSRAELVPYMKELRALLVPFEKHLKA